MNKHVVGTTQRRINDAAATERLLTRHCKNAHKALAEGALWNDKSTLEMTNA